MPLVALVCAGLLGWADDAAPTHDVVAEYRRAQAAASHTPDDQIRLALWCEAHGLTAERMRHLALAVLADPTNATARGLAGLVARNGRWVAPDSVALSVQTDAGTVALLAQYDQRRSQTPYNADAQWLLGVWADEQGLKEQARAHFTAVTRLDPSQDRAWKRLGYKQHDGRWTTHAQIVKAEAEADAQRRADHTWRPLLEKWQGMLAQPSKQEAARAALLGVTDPRALPAIRRVFGTGRPGDQRVAVDLLGQLASPEASQTLAILAVHGTTEEVRRVATEILASRDPREFVDGLVRLIHKPWRLELRPAAQPGGKLELFVEGERYNISRLYTPPPAPPRTFSDGLPLDPAATPAGNGMNGMIPRSATADRPLLGRLARTASPNTEMIWNVDQPPASRHDQIARVRDALKSNDKLARETVANDVRAMEMVNEAIRVSNDRVLPVLVRVTGRNLGEDHEAWARWDQDRRGYAYQSTSEKPTFLHVVDVPYQTQITHHSCFAVGTAVQTISGPKPIERIERGDLVLSQDTASGALTYQPVLTAFHNPPSATYRVKLGEDEVVATGIHRFWKAGKGWTMARDLEEGDSLRVLGGVATVAAVTPERTQPVYNLEVAEGRNFFVGRVGALVHDNSMVEATPNPFDAPRAVATAATSR